MPDGRTTVGSEVVPGESAVSATSQELIIQTEQIGWNQFRFRPASRLGVGTFEYEWIFGDGQTSTERVIEHTYAKPGRYSVSLRLVDPDGGQQTASMMVRVGFFHLANWRLWVIIGLLALIIILAATTAGVSESLVPEVSGVAPRKAGDDEDEHHDAEEVDIEPLSSDGGNLESLASTGEDTGDLSDGLALLESLGSSDQKIQKPANSQPVAIESQLDTPVALEPMKTEEPTEPVAKPKAKKKTTKKRPTKKRTIKVKNVS